MDAGALYSLKNLLEHPRSTIRKESTWVISNITAGTPGQVQAVLEAGILPILLNHLQFSDLKIKKEACWAVCNALSIADTHSNLLKYFIGFICLDI